MDNFSYPPRSTADPYDMTETALRATLCCNCGAGSLFPCPAHGITGYGVFNPLYGLGEDFSPMPPPSYASVPPPLSIPFMGTTAALVPMSGVISKPQPTATLRAAPTLGLQGQSTGRLLGPSSHMQSSPCLTASSPLSDSDCSAAGVT